MNPDKVFSVLHNIAIQRKQPPLKDEVSDYSYPDDVLDFEQTADICHQDVLRFLSIISAIKFPYKFVE